MIIKKFLGSKVNGYLDFDIDFIEDLTFLTGINGTGKTSVLNSIASLLMPKLDFLTSHPFGSISICIENNDKIATLEANQFSDEDDDINCTLLTCSLYPDDNLLLMPFSSNDDYPTSRTAEAEREYYKRILDENANHPIINFIRDLPTPMFLGLDRRSRSSEIETRYGSHYMNPRRSSYKKRNIFGNSLSGSLNEALFFSERRIRDNLRKKSILDRKFRDNLVLELLNFPPIDFAKLMASDELVDPYKLKRAKANIYKIPDLLGVSGDKVLTRINELFEFIEQKMQIAQDLKNPESVEEPWDNPAFEARLTLAHNKSNIDKINILSKMVSSYTNDLKAIFSHVDEFTKIVNDFIQDSGKSLGYDEAGEIVFRVGKESVGKDIRTLSSGEIQLIVIFAHLYFNPETEKANVFIIDEPELSLHVQWQEKFVNSLLKTSKGTQFIMATHSPTVIIGRTDHCIEISQSK